MSTRRSIVIAAAGGAGLLLSPGAGAQVEVWTDPAGDAVVRRTDPGADGPLSPGCTLPDIVSVTLCAWEAPDAKNDPYNGWPAEAKDSHLMRLEFSLLGVICPPGPLGLNGDAYDPLRYGESPVYGYLDIDLDDRKDTGGVLGLASQQRYLANIARFGRVPEGSIAERAAISAEDYDAEFFSAPQYERSGADWNLAFCGCFSVTIVAEDGDQDQVFEAGETWIVRGRFFERATGYIDASDAFGGSGFGRYDPRVNLRFRHDETTDMTTVTLVYALDMAGAAALTGQNEQEIDLSVANHTSIAEGLTDIIDNAGNLTGPVEVLAEDWEGRDAEDYLDPTDWEATALLGTAYTAPSGSLFAWTDTGFWETPGDLDGDGLGDHGDAGAVYGHVLARDGTPGDADGVTDGRVQIPSFGLNFSVYDLNGDGWIDGEDLWTLGHRADMDRNGVLDIFDFLLFQNFYVGKQPLGDFDFDGQFTLFDFLAYVNAFNK